MDKLFWFRIVAGWAAVYHGGLALIGLFAPPELVQSTADVVFGVNLDMTAQMAYLVKFIAAYFVVFAGVMGLLAAKPMQYRDLVWVAVGLFGIRIVTRFVYLDLLRDAFGGDFGRDMITVAVISVISVLLLTLRPTAPQSH